MPDSLKTLKIRDIIDKNGTVRVPVVQRRQGEEPFLSSRVPDSQVMPLRGTSSPHQPNHEPESLDCHSRVAQRQLFEIRSSEIFLAPSWLAAQTASCRTCPKGQ